MAVKPFRLKADSTIGVVAPAGPYSDEGVFRKALESIQMLGFNIVLGSSVHKKDGYLAGSDYDRAEDINSFFCRTDIDGIICLRGGYGTLRILNKIDFKAIKKNPKVFVGYSDITAIHIAIKNKCNMVTFHGPMLYSDFGKEMDNYSRCSFLRAVTTSDPYGELKNPEGTEKIKVLLPGSATGKMVGGNLTVIISTIGTPYEINTRDKMLLMEEVGEEPYRVDRMLTQLLLCGKLQECSGIILGQWTRCSPEEPEKSLSLIEVFYDRLSSLGIPILYNVAFGHEKTKATIPLGVKGTITGDGRFIISEEGVL